jgi:predicted lipid-binding transport protein (Tim44 family)
MSFGKADAPNESNAPKGPQLKRVNAKEVSAEILQIQAAFSEYQNKSIVTDLETMFDAIFQMFANSRHEELKKMLSASMYESFAEQIAKREEKNLRQEIDIKHTKTTISKVENCEQKIVLIVLFDVSQMSATINSEDVSYDNPGRLHINIRHKWIFERAKVDDSKWVLTKTTIDV